METKLTYKTILFISLILLLFLIKWEKSFKNYKLTHYCKSYWDVYKSNWRDNENNSIKVPYRLYKMKGFYFTATGYCESLQYNGKLTGEIVRISTSRGHIWEDPFWYFYENDSINIRGYRYKILKFSQDTLKLKWHNMNYPDTLILVRRLAPIKRKINGRLVEF